MEYELFYLIGASKEADAEKIKKEAEKIVEENGGKFSEKTTVEKRRLSYEVKHETHGIYIARRFELENGSKIQEITNKLNLHPDILRFIISKAEDLPELKSKEERIAEAEKKEKDRRDKKEEVKEVKEIKKDSKPKKVEKIKEEKVEKEKVNEDKKEKKAEKNEDIDKKLEEILNI